MTAVANPPSFANINRPAWGNSSQSLNGSSNHDDARSMFAPRKSMQRTNSSSSIASNASSASNASNASASSTLTVISANGPPTLNGGPVGGTGGSGAPSPANSGNDANGLPITTLRKRPLQKAQWSGNKPESQTDFLRGSGGGGAQGRQQIGPGPNGVASLHQLPPFVPGGQSAASGTNGTNGIMARPPGPEAAPQQGQPVLYLVSLNGTFERKTISVPFIPDTLRIGRQTNKSTTPNNVNGYFDSKVLSRQHAEIYSDRQGKIWIRDIKSSNGTFVNGTRLSAENRESEPHELQTNDHLELGIDIVSEDQKSVVHHKVAAKVEHAGFINTSNSLLDMNFGDLDPANGAIMGPQINGMPFRGRTGSQASLGPAGRVAPTSNMAAAQNNGLALQRGLWLTGPSTEAIVKKIHQEMRNAKQQSQDLQRTQEFIQALLSKDDIRNEPNPKSEAGAGGGAGAAADPLSSSRPPPLQMVNGNNSLSFRADPKARFSDPPAPPPQQPLPEKPDVPSLKRGSTERPKSGAASNTSPIRPDVMGQVLQLTDALNTAKREIVTQHSRMRELEDKLHREQEARRYAEELSQQIEMQSSIFAPAMAAADSAAAAAAAAVAPRMNGAAKSPGGGRDREHNRDLTLEEAFEPPLTTAATTSSSLDAKDDDDDIDDEEKDSSADAAFRARIDSMMTEMEGMKRQLKAFQERAEKAEAERDADRETLADMVQRIRRRDEDDAKLAAEAEAAAAATAAAAAVAAAAATSRSASSTTKAATTPTTTTPLPGSATGDSASRSRNSTTTAKGDAASTESSATASGHDVNSAASARSRLQKQQQQKPGDGLDDDDDLFDASLSRSNTITPASLTNKVTHDPTVLHGIPYASMVGVVLIGMGLMAYLNGWQPSPGRLDR